MPPTPRLPAARSRARSVRSAPKAADDRFFRHVVSSMRNGVIAIRRDGTLALMNNEAYRIFSLNQRENFEQTARYVELILKGANPAGLPVATATKFKLVINLKTAKQIGVNIPQSLLYRADKVIK